MSINKNPIVKMSAFLFLVLTTGIPGISNAGSAEDLAKSAFFAIEENPFDTNVVQDAERKIYRAYKEDPKDPWVLIALSRATLENGYMRGDRSKLSTYAPGYVDKAGEFAKAALQRGAHLGMAHIQYAKIQMINGDLKGSWLTLNRAYELNREDFYPWYYRAVISIRMGDYRIANSYLDKAGAYAKKDYQKSWVADRRIYLAKLLGDESAIESAYKKTIEADPKSPHAHGNYANYLKSKKRYAEAISYYRKAIEIAPYPLAQEGLKETLILQEKEMGRH